MAASPVVVDKDGGDYIWFAGGLFTFKVTSEQSDGAYILAEDSASRGKTTPLHLHPDHDESFFIIEGEMLLHIDGEEQTAGTGAITFVPRGTPHAFLITSDQTRFLTLITPGDRNAEAFFREGGTPAPDRVSPPAGTPLDIPRLVEAGNRTGAMKVLGPPPFDLARAAAAEGVSS